MAVVSSTVGTSDTEMGSLKECHETQTESCASEELLNCRGLRRESAQYWADGVGVVKNRNWIISWRQELARTLACLRGRGQVRFAEKGSSVRYPDTPLRLA